MTPLTILMVALVLIASLTGCRHTRDEPVPTLTTAVLQDRNGFSETISQRDRLARLEELDFRSQQSYQKVIRVFSRDERGEIPSVLTTYHPNGQLHHWLEVSSGRACGRYEQRFPTGKIKMEARVLGGSADLTEAAMASWQFDGICRVFFPSGALQAEIPYEKGVLHGEERRFHSEGGLALRRTFSRGLLDGVEQEFNERGTLVMEAHHRRGQLDGALTRWDASGHLLDEEIWVNDRLVSGRYGGLAFLPEGAAPVTVVDGCGWRPLRDEQARLRLVQIQEGRPEGWVRLFTSRGNLEREWEEVGGEKQGKERLFFTRTGGTKLEMSWAEGSLSGSCRSFYPDGSPESCWEMLDNQRHGRTVAWFRSGAIMLIEDYDRGKLVKGEYFEPGHALPVSHVYQGSGMATLHQADGRLLRKVAIQDGEPIP